jgi:hypothetical protein
MAVCIFFEAFQIKWEKRQFTCISILQKLFSGWIYWSICFSLLAEAVLVMALLLFSREVDSGFQ